MKRTAPRSSKDGGDSSAEWLRQVALCVCRKTHTQTAKISNFIFTLNTKTGRSAVMEMRSGFWEGKFSRHSPAVHGCYFTRRWWKSQAHVRLSTSKNRDRYIPGIALSLILIYNIWKVQEKQKAKKRKSRRPLICISRSPSVNPQKASRKITLGRGTLVNPLPSRTSLKKQQSILFLKNKKPSLLIQAVYS